MDVGGSVYNSDGYVELQIPNTAIGMDQDTSSICVVLFSVDMSSGKLQDTVPSDPKVPGISKLSRFSAVSERMNLVYPPSTVAGDPSTLSSILPFYWDWPTGYDGSTPFAGSVLQVDLDQEYSPPHEANIQITSKSSYLSENNVTLMDDIVGNHQYFWRVQPRYWRSGYVEIFGAWSGGWSFSRAGFTAENLSTSISFGTPTFRWDMAEGVDSYQLQVSSDPNFGTSAIDIVTTMNSFTPKDSLLQGHYYWRVKIIRDGNIENDWSPVEQFNLILPAPTGLAPDGETVSHAPTFCWNPLIGYDNGKPVLTAWKYHVQVSQDPAFNFTYDSIETNNNCWTPTKEYNDHIYFWRIAMIDGNNNLGSYSPTATFTKLYPVPTLVSPIDGFVLQTPTFIWKPVNGAAMYEFELSLFPTFSPLFVSVATVNTQYIPNLVIPPDHVYYWRVAMRDLHGNQGPFATASILIKEEKHIFLPLVNR
jgi:hypothetical protein